MPTILPYPPRGPRGARERAKELLRVLDYYAAPFGGEEWVFMNYGLAGAHHTVGADSVPVQTDQGKAEIGDLWHLATGKRAFFHPIPPGAAKAMQHFAKELYAIGIDDLALGLFSPTGAARGGRAAATADRPAHLHHRRARATLGARHLCSGLA